jgi:hypothetical protein
VINNQVDLAKGIDLGWVQFHFVYSSSHGSEINDGWDTSEVLQNNSGRFEWNLNTILSVVDPVEDSLDIVFYFELMVKILTYS